MGVRFVTFVVSFIRCEWREAKERVGNVNGRMFLRARLLSRCGRRLRKAEPTREARILKCYLGFVAFFRVVYLNVRVYLGGGVFSNVSGGYCPGMILGMVTPHGDLQGC